MLTASTHWVEDNSKGEVEGHVVLVAAHNTIEVQSEFCQVEVFGR